MRVRPFQVVLIMALPLGLVACIGGSGSQTSTDSTSGRSTTQPGGAATRGSDAQRRYKLDSLPTSTVSIDEHAFRVWLAQEFDAARPGVQQEGLMFVPTGEIADDQGMLFVFDSERMRGFWMLNTIAPLDIAYARTDGTIVATWTMPALAIHSFSSIEPAMFALEVKAGTFAKLGIKAGDRLVFTDDVFRVR